MNDRPVSVHVADELVRMLDRQKELDPATRDYEQLVTNLETLIFHADLYLDVFEYLQAAGRLPTPFDEPEITQVVLHPEFVKAVQEAKEEEPETEEPQPEPEPAQTYTLVEVRAACREAKKRGVDITTLIKSFGVNYLTDLPAEKYGELMKKLEEN